MSQASALCESEAWTLTASLLFKIIREMNTARSIVKQARESEPLLYVWWALKTHEVMERFMANHFRDDPALTGILVQHIIPRRNNVDSTSKLTIKIVFMEGKLATVQTNIRKKANKEVVTREMAKKNDI
jgi:hypothetical protein